MQYFLTETNVQKCVLIFCLKPDMIAVVTLFILQYLYASAVRKYLDPREVKVLLGTLDSLGPMGSKENWAIAWLILTPLNSDLEILVILDVT